jgi:hypothetical protein
MRARVSHQFTVADAQTAKCFLKSSGVPAHAILNAATPTGAAWFEANAWAKLEFAAIMAEIKMDEANR